MWVDLILRILFAVALFGAVTTALWGGWTVFGSGQARHRLRQRLTGQPATETKAGDDDGEATLLVVDETSALRKILSKFSLTRELQASLKQAFPDLSPEKFLGVVAAVAFVVGMILFTFRGSFLAAGIGMIFGAYLPFMYLARRRLKRQRMISEQLPDGLDFLGRSLRAGHSLPVGLSMMGNELPVPLRDEFGRCHDQISLGTAPDAALKDMTERIESTDFAFFVTAVLVQRQTGGDLAQVLDNITGMLRMRIQLENQVKAKTAEGRFTGMILAAFPLVMFVMLYVMSPENTSVLTDTFEGRLMLGATLLLSGMGLFVIRKITAVRV